MIEFLYKYSAIREDFFVEPMLRATPVHYLNDPFEGSITLEQMINAHKKNNKFFGAEEEFHEDEFMYQMNDQLTLARQDLMTLGIISFTEDHINPLMWSHYANEHKGIVIQYKLGSSFLAGSNKVNSEGKKVRYDNDVFGQVSELPSPVMYRRNRPAFDIDEETNPKSRTSYPHSTFNKYILHTKANDWIYEKEHRSVLLLQNADRIVCDYNSRIQALCDKDKVIDLKVIKNRCIITYPLNYERDEDVGDESIRFEIYLEASFSDIEPIFLFRIDPSVITGFYFGCNVPPSDFERYSKQIKNNPIFSHVKRFHHAQIMDDRYEITYNVEKELDLSI